MTSPVTAAEVTQSLVKAPKDYIGERAGAEQQKKMLGRTAADASERLRDRPDVSFLICGPKSSACSVRI